MKRIRLDGRTTSTLQWKPAKDEALGYSAILWELDLGLFDRLSHPIQDQPQFLALTLSLEHFRDTVWKEFKEQTAGLCLYHGPADFSRNFRWDDVQWDHFKEWLQKHFETPQKLREETSLESDSFDTLVRTQFEETQEGRRLLALFCRDVCVEYIQLLANRLPEGLDAYVVLDAAGIESPLLELQLLTRERFDRLHCLIHNSRLNHSEQKAELGVCVPLMEKVKPSEVANLKGVLASLAVQKTSFRLIPEHLLISEWDGLDELIVCESGLSPAGRRMLKGFEAAGGIVTLV